ncbi:Golgi transport complex subunit 1 [Dissophora globulifera]|uniref:Conserved oligomeric Golgi complex subunit 1 n=1 Tax=Dissophora globulifera TaxID=979702 RepID=A0A9P6RA10_9FUNG|nr:Golgi transport complex subunit 1 [Dissophora globulifera]
MTTMAPAGADGTKGKKPVDADELFMMLSVPELNVYERRTRQDIENKKQELRMMVGERYRDLIGAADCIVRMKETAFSIQDNIARMRDSCDIHTLKRNVAVKTKKAQSGSMDDMKKSLYTSAAQIKLLADVPEQIWRNMENSSYLTASRLYLISKAIYKNLNASAANDDSQSVRVMETFPVVGRQWDAVSHFKAQILQKSHQHLKSAKESALDVTETICAIMLLDDVTIKDMFRQLLAQRQTAIREALRTSGDGGDIGARTVKAIEILHATLFHINQIFVEAEPGKASQLERHLRSLQQTFAGPTHNPSMASMSKEEHGLGATGIATTTTPTPTTGSSLTMSVIPKLYPTTPNIHLLVRYLPESVQNFTPFIHLEGPQAAFTQQDVFQGVQRWMDDVKAMFSQGFEGLLQQVHTSTDLVAIRSKVWAALKADEFALLTASLPAPATSSSASSSTVKAVATSAVTKSRRKNSAFNEMCGILLGAPFSIWDSILRSGFAKSFQDVIVYSLEELSLQPEKLIWPRLGELDQEEDPNHDIGKFVWNDTMATRAGGAAASPVTAAAALVLPSATQPLIKRIHEYVSGKTDLVALATGAFEEKLGAIRSDQELALTRGLRTVMGRDASDDEDEDDEDDDEGVDLFSAKADTKELIEFYQRQCVECIKAYSTSLDGLVQEAVRKPERARNTIPALDRAMTVGRIALGISTMGPALQRALASSASSAVRSSASTSRDPSHGGGVRSTTNFAQARADKANVEAQTQALVKMLRKVYMSAHEAWVGHVEWVLNRGVKHYLAESSWTDVATLAWEPIPTAGTEAGPGSRPGSAKTTPGTTSMATMTTAAEETATLLPFHCSTRLITALHQVAQEMHRVGTGFLRPELIQMLMTKLAVVVLRDVDQFLNTVVDPSSSLSPTAESQDSNADSDKVAKVVMSEKGAMQMLFDIKVVKLVFQACVDKDAELTKTLRSVVDRIRGRIDPINLAVFEKPLDVNADRQYGRVSVLLGLLVQLNPVESRRRTNVGERSPHVFAMAPLTARFTLLPIGQKMTGRV